MNISRSSGSSSNSRVGYSLSTTLRDSDSDSSFSLNEVSLSSQSSFRRNPLFFPLIISIILGILFLILAIVGFSRTSSSSSSSSSSKYHSSIIPPAIPLPDASYQTVIFLQLNDIYEMMPLSNRGGLSRVNTVRNSLLTENSATITVLAGDFLSPSAVSLALVGIPPAPLNGKQMIDCFNLLGVDYVTYGNHEFDLNQQDLLSRITESKFQWISLNTYNVDGSLFPTSSVNNGYQYIEANGMRILIIGVTIDTNMGRNGPGPKGGYVFINNTIDTIKSIKLLLVKLSNTYDICIALTHWTVEEDIQLVEAIPAIHLVMGGHEHANYYLSRGTTFTPISKSDSNDATVYIHRVSLSKTSIPKIIIQSSLLILDSNIPLDTQSELYSRINYWFNLSMSGFESQGYSPLSIVCNLGTTELDGRSSIVRSDRNNVLARLIAESLLLDPAFNNNNNLLSIHNTGSIRIDDFLSGSVTQYDVLRVLPFSNYAVLVQINGSTLLNILNDPSNRPDSGEFLSVAGILSYNSGYFINGDQYIDPSSIYYTVTTNYLLEEARLHFKGNYINPIEGQQVAKDFIKQLQQAFPT